MADRIARRSPTSQPLWDVIRAAWFSAGAAPWGWRGRAFGVGGGFGASRPGWCVSHFPPSGEAAQLAGTMPASWRADCHAMRAVACRMGNPGSSQRDREAAPPRDNATLCDPLFRGEGHCEAGSIATKRIKVRPRHEGANAQCLLSGVAVSKARPQARTQEHRQPRRSFVSTPPLCRWPVIPHCRVCENLGVVNCSDASLAERRARAATRWEQGRARTHGPQPAGEVSD